MLAKGAGGITQEVGIPTMKGAVRKGLRDFIRPLFWAPVLVVVTLILAAGSSWEQAMWVVVRAVTVGWVLFSFARLIDPRKIASWLRRRGHWGPALALTRALRPQTTSPNRESHKESH